MPSYGRRYPTEDYMKTARIVLGIFIALSISTCGFFAVLWITVNFGGFDFESNFFVNNSTDTVISDWLLQILGGTIACVIGTSAGLIGVFVAEASSLKDEYRDATKSWVSAIFACAGFGLLFGSCWFANVFFYVMAGPFYGGLLMAVANPLAVFSIQYFDNVGS